MANSSRSPELSGKVIVNAIEREGSRTLMLTVKVTTRMKKVMDHICKLLNAPLNKTGNSQIWLLFRGELVLESDTPASLGMSINDTVEFAFYDEHDD